MRCLRIFLLTFVFSQWASLADAVPIIDQSFDAASGDHTSGPVYATSFWYQQAQTFTVGVSGSLTGAGMWLGACCASSQPDPGPLDPLTIQLRRTTGGQPAANFGDVLSSVQLTQADIRAAQTSDEPFSVAWIEWSFSNAPLVSAGDQLALVLVGYNEPNPVLGSDAAYWALGDNSDGPRYERGAALYQLLEYGGPWYDASGDIYFKTWVDAAVPEPGLLFVVSAGLGALAIRRVARPGPRSCTSPSRRPS